MEEEIKTTGTTGAQETPTAEGEGEEKTRKIKVTFERKLFIIRTGIANALKPGLFRQYVEEFGYNETRLNEGMGLLTNTDTARTNQKSAIALKVQKTREADNKKYEANNLYKHYVVIGREEFQDNLHILDKLGLEGERKEDFGGWREQAMRLYENVGTPGVLEGYAKHSITAEDLEAGKQAVLDWEKAIADRNEAKAEAEKATELKNKAFRELLKWWRGFVKVVDVALQDDPQLKEQINIVVP
ncbi:MAG: hypothetical protein GTO45_31180 [Candidatus Aminicenantes bacterium]|nr:hypothetical protein [Candidatus Aminicenantes bacterium]NIM83262.1 hypothetical protein [Candidatus Aminicenantes bacterium]NIN22633.1 hypothetical protein [Candidatus Aminicenantes bacterium]NIN46392.1 hypothetical protein [Candidatus Aminicenantes bacterium]NIN89242.1 hypothetical protein [Candidatus Aminicenantes bacterium]